MLVLLLCTAVVPGIVDRGDVLVSSVPIGNVRLTEDGHDETEVLGAALLLVPDEQGDVEVVTPATSTAATTSSASPTTTTPRAITVSSEVNDPNEGEGTPALLISAAIAGLLGLVAFLLIRNRASKQSTSEAVAAATESSKLSVTDLLDASRRMTAALDAVQISKIALAEATRLVQSEGGLVAVRSTEGLTTVHHEPQSLFVVDALADSSLRRVVETGRSVSTVAMDEPVLVEVPMAMAAVPIVADGTITGAIMVVRLASEPFGRHELEALEMLAPLVGSAFHAAQAHGSATALADVEPMTGLKNRRRLDRDLAATGDDLVAYIMLDVDHFKNFNDVNGHAAGDEALRRVASTLAASVRPGDVVYRYGGEEFCVLLPATTSAEARDVAERIRADIEACEIPGEEKQPNGRVTVSIGVADTSTKTVADLVERADAALYKAKDAGRNQVMIDLTTD